MPARLFRANCELVHRSKQNLYSITSVARNRVAVGIVTPIIFAVLRLSTTSNLVGCSIGKSAGFDPLAMRST
jgi:hypothetical protein